VTDAATATLVGRSTTFLAVCAAIARLALGREVGVRASFRNRRVIQVRIHLASRTHVATEDAATRVRSGTGGLHIRQKRLIAVTLDVVTGVVADVMVVAGRGEVDIAIRADLVRNEVADDAVGRAAAVEFRHVTGVRHPIGAEIEIGDRVERLHAGRFAALAHWIVRNAVASRHRCLGDAWCAHTNRGEHASKRRAK